jgi:hypothetical protein
VQQRTSFMIQSIIYDVCGVLNSFIKCLKGEAAEPIGDAHYLKFHLEPLGDYSYDSITAELIRGTFSINKPLGSGGGGSLRTHEYKKIFQKKIKVLLYI